MNTQHYKEMLEREQALIEVELATVGRKNPDNPSDWEATEPEDGNEAEEGDVAENISEFQNNTSILENLETQLNSVREALKKIEAGKYGLCNICGSQIEEDRLEANPSAPTCKLHMK